MLFLSILSSIFLLFSGCQKGESHTQVTTEPKNEETQFPTTLPPLPMPFAPNPWVFPPEHAPPKATREGNSDEPFNPCPGEDKDLDGFGSNCDCDDENPRVQPGFACLANLDLNICQFEICDPDLSGDCIIATLPGGTVCNPVLQGPCDAPDHCDENGACVDEKHGSDTVCRKSVGACNTQEVCDGVDNECPEDTFASQGTPCGVNGQGMCLGNGNCDRVNTCPNSPPGDPDSDGDNWPNACDCAPNDPSIYPGQPCPSDGLECTIDICDPDLSATCLHVVRQVGQACGNGPTDLCDLQDTCASDGSCKDNIAPEDFVCRFRAHSCDRVERCDGQNKTCPSNNFAPVGTLCGPGIQAPCDLPDRCDQNGNCQKLEQPAGFVCREATGECDTTEVCDGVNTSCPADDGKADGTPCGLAPDGACDLADSCLAFVCVDNVLSGTICRPSISIEQCDPSEVCDGVAHDCPGNQFVENGNTGDPCLASSGLGLSISAECLGDSGTVLCINGGSLCYPTDQAQCFDQAISREDADFGVNSGLGFSVSIDEGFAVAGAIGANPGGQGFNSGAIVKMERDAQNQWSIRVVLGVPTEDSGNSSVKDFIQAQNTLLGYAVDNIGSYSLGSAPRINYNTNSLGTKNNAGAVFTHLGSSLIESIIGSQPEDNANFGQSVSFDGAWAIVGEPEANNILSFNGSGAVEFYSYIANGARLSFEQRIIPSDNQSDDHFGEAVGIYGEWALVGAPEDDINDTDDAGSVYFYKYDALTNRWGQTQKIASPNIDDNNNFGEAVAIYGDVAVVGEPRDDANGFDDLGKVYVYRLSGNTWVLEQILAPTVEDENAAFGYSVAIQDNVIVVGQPGDPTDVIATLDDRAYIYTFNGSWQLFGDPLTGDGLENTSDGFGLDVDIQGDWIIIGAPFSFTGDAVFFYYFPYQAISTPILVRN